MSLLLRSPPTLLAMGPDWLANWLTPIWLLGVGTLIGLALLLALGLAIRFVSPQGGQAIWQATSEGVLWPAFLLACALAAFSVVGLAVVRRPAEIMASLTRLLDTGTVTRQGSFKGSANIEQAYLPDSAQPISVRFRGDELTRLEINSNQPVLVTSQQLDEEISTGSPNTVAIEPNVLYEWLRGEESVPPFGKSAIETLYVHNLATDPADVSISVTTRPVFPEVSIIPTTAISVVLFFGLYWLQQLLAPKLSAVALATAKSEIAQPLFPIIVVTGLFLLILFVIIPYHTFGEDIKMLKDSSLTLIMVLGIIQALWGASNSVYDEIEGKTALTVLSKPIGRRQFILGKFFGIVWVVALLFVILGACMLVCVAYKPIYDSRETANLEPNWQQCHYEMAITVPGLVLAFLETVVLASLSVAISTRLPLMANIVICFAIYVLGHLTPLIVQSSAVDEFEPVAFIGSLIATLIPVLEQFNIQAAVAAGVEVPNVYLLHTLIYCVLYSALALLLALVLFEDRDLA